MGAEKLQGNVGVDCAADNLNPTRGFEHPAEPVQRRLFIVHQIRPQLPAHTGNRSRTAVWPPSFETSNRAFGPNSASKRLWRLWRPCPVPMASAVNPNPSSD